MASVSLVISLSLAMASQALLAPSVRENLDVDVELGLARSLAARPGKEAICAGSAEHRAQPGWIKPHSDHKFAWVHMEKTGTSFINTLANWACNMQPEDKCLDGPEHWGSISNKCVEQFTATPMLGEYHALLTDEMYKANKGGLITFVRSPVRDHRRSYWSDKIMSPRDGAKNHYFNLHSKGELSFPQFLEVSRGYQVGFLVGVFPNVYIKVTKDHLEEAKKRLSDGFRFVGLSHRWAESICLFHAMFGAGQCRGCEFARVKRNQDKSLHWKPSGKDLAALEAYEDDLDEALVRHAQKLFEERRKEYGVNAGSCQACSCTDSSPRNATW